VARVYAQTRCPRSASRPVVRPFGFCPPYPGSGLSLIFLRQYGAEEAAPACSPTCYVRVIGLFWAHWVWARLPWDIGDFWSAIRRALAMSFREPTRSFELSDCCG